MKKGFTLIELSIVLVVIGFLIGGILAAQSMMASARIQGFLKEQQEYVIAFQNFKTTYNKIPGDAPNSIFPVAAASSSNDDGDIDNYLETGRAWTNLSQTGMVKEEYNFSGSASLFLRTDIPESRYYKFLAYKTTPGSGWANSFPLAFYMIGAVPSTLSTQNNYAVIPSLDSLSIDKKIDDGLPNTGKVTADHSNFIDGSDGIYVAANRCRKSSDSIYNTTSTAKCTLHLIFQDQMQ